MLRIAERLTFWAADVSLATNESFREIAITRGKMSPARVFVVKTGTDLREVNNALKHPSPKKDRRYLVVYVGIMEAQDGVDLLLESIRYLVKRKLREDVTFALIGSGTETVHLDIHDIVPEFYASKFKSSQKSVTFKLLVAMERMSAAFSDHVVVANHIWEKRLRERSVKGTKCTTILNYPDTHLFHKRGRDRKDNKFIILYPGTINYHQGLDIAIRAFSLIKNEVPEAEFHIYGSGDQFNFLRSLIDELGLQHRVYLKGLVAIDQMASVIENADLGVVSKRSTGFGNEAFSTKILEFMSMGVPVIVPDTAIDQYYFNDSVATFFHANDARSLADAMVLLFKNPELRRKLVLNASEFVKKYTWDVNESIYLNLVSSLLQSRNGHRHF